MKKKLIFHIGTHRTATSALQHYLFQNIPALKRKGILYPFGVRRHRQTINNIFSKKQTPQIVSDNLLRRANSQKNDIHTILLSDEDICMRKKLRLLGDFRKTFDVKVVFTLRRQDLWLESWYLQNIKWQWDPALSHCTFGDFLAKSAKFHWIHYDRYVRHLESVFGQENVVLNVYEKQQMRNGPISAFCDSIGLTPSEDFVPPRIENASFSPLMSEFMRNLPLDEALPKYRSVLTQVCARVDERLNADNHGSKLLLSYSARNKVLQKHAEGNRALAQRYFGRDELFFDPMPDPDAAQADMTLPVDSHELMEKFVRPLLSEIIQYHHNSENAPNVTGKSQLQDQKVIGSQKGLIRPHLSSLKSWFQR